ncbi:MAG: GNAT family N-acetyltransferase [Alphaproteobacteria bacterium]
MARRAISATFERASPGLLAGARLTLRRFGPEAVDERYLAWLNDPVVNAHSRRFGITTNAAEARLYLASLGPDEAVLGIHHHALGHVGNIKYGPIDRTDSRADISILIGERAAWGQGIGREAVYLVTRFLFREAGLNRVDAGSGNPAFVRLVQSLGWRIEGVQRERVRIGDRYLDWTLLAQLRAEFVERPGFHSPAP